MQNKNADFFKKKFDISKNEEVMEHGYFQVYFLKLSMGEYLRIKFQVYSITVTSFL